MRKTVLICVLAASVMASAGCFGNRDKNCVEAPKEEFDPEEATKMNEAGSATGPDIPAHHPTGR